MLPTRGSLDLVDGAQDEPSGFFHAVTPHSYSPIIDVREGGVKRDLTTLLERPIKRNGSGVAQETKDEFMLYRFKTKDRWVGSGFEEAVPIHDLAAYYQLYSRPYGDGFFFEIVQRQSGYTGYGAANAPYRTAALRRLLGNMRTPTSDTVIPA